MQLQIQKRQRKTFSCNLTLNFGEIKFNHFNLKASDFINKCRYLNYALTSQLRSSAICSESSCNGMTVRMPCRQSTCSGTSIVLYACAFVSASFTLQITIGFPYTALFKLPKRMLITNSTCNKTGDYIHCLSKEVYHPTTNENFNNTCPISVIFGTNITEWICHCKVI